MIWEQVRARFLFRRVDIRGADAPLASATKTGVSLREDNEQGVWNPGDDVSNYKLVQPGQFVIGLRSFQHGFSCSDIRGLVSPAYTVFSGGSQVEPRFYRHYFRSAEFISRIENVAQGIRQGKTIDYADFADLALPVPPIDEQRRIADFLDSETARIDRLIRLRQQQQSLNLERFRSLLAAEVLVGTGEPRSVTRLKYLFEFERNGLWGDEPRGDADDVPVVRVADFDRDNFRVGPFETVRSVPLRLRSHRLLRRGDVLLEKSGGSADKPVGCAVIFDADGPAICSNFVAALRPVPSVDATYVGYLMAALYQTKRNAPFVTQTTGIQNLDSGNYLGLAVGVPSRAEQTDAVRRVEAAREFTSKVQRLHKRHEGFLRERREATIAAAVGGQLDATTARGAA